MYKQILAILKIIFINQNTHKAYSTANMFLTSASISEMDTLDMLLQHDLCEIAPRLTILSVVAEVRS